MLAPFSNYPVNEAFERLIAEERAARADKAQISWFQCLAAMIAGRQPSSIRELSRSAS